MARLRDAFLLDPELVFLNHGSFGACPRPVLGAQARWQREMERNPVAFFGRGYAARLAEARAELAAYLGADGQDLAWLPNTTVGVGMVAESLAATLAPGDEVVTTDLEYGACLAAWQRACGRAGAVLRVLTVPLPFEPEVFGRQISAACGPRTRVLFASHITSTTALRLPVESLVHEARARGVTSVIDGAHAPGQIALALDALGADFYVGNLHKWLCAPKGSAFVHARRPWHERLLPPVVSWGQVADAEQGSQSPSPHDAYTGRSALERRLLWQGTRDIAAWLAVPEAIRFVQAHGGPADAARATALALATRDAVLAHNGLRAIAPDGTVARMVAIPLRCTDPRGLQQWLFERHRIEIPITQHAGQPFARLSVAPYTSAAECEQLVAALAEADAQVQLVQGAGSTAASETQ
jgi:isopenicillin-N epimerase